MIKFIEDALVGVGHVGALYHVGRFLGACVVHEFDEWVEREPERARRLADRLGWCTS